MIAFKPRATGTHRSYSSRGREQRAPTARKPTPRCGYIVTQFDEVILNNVAGVFHANQGCRPLDSILVRGNLRSRIRTCRALPIPIENRQWRGVILAAGRCRPPRERRLRAEIQQQRVPLKVYTRWRTHSCRCSLPAGRRRLTHRIRFQHQSRRYRSHLQFALSHTVVTIQVAITGTRSKKHN